MSSARVYGICNFYNYLWTNVAGAFFKIEVLFSVEVKPQTSHLVDNLFSYVKLAIIVSQPPQISMKADAYYISIRGGSRISKGRGLILNILRHTLADWGVGEVWINTS